MTSIATIVSPTGEMNVTINGIPYAVGLDHPSYTEIKTALTEAVPEDLLDEDFADYLLDQIDISKAVSTFVNSGSSDTVKAEVVNGQVMVNGRPLSNVLTDRILELKSKGFRYIPMLRFLENLELNPSFNSREQLMGFLEHMFLPITEDGCFMAYKSVTQDYKDHHTQTFDNSPGAKHTMERRNVDDNQNAACSTGFHVGTMEYARGFGSGNRRLVLVKVNPRDAVSVPTDHSCQKLRVSSYEVIQEISAEDVLRAPVVNY